MEAIITEEKVPSDFDNSFVKEKLNDSVNSRDDEIKTDAMLDEVAARVDALDFNNIDEPKDPKEQARKQAEIIKKQAETINTLITQLRIMFDEYNDAVNEKGYYEDLSEALLRYIEICEGKIELEQDESETENTTPRNQDGSEEMIATQDVDVATPAAEKDSTFPSDTQQRSEDMEGAGATAAAATDNNNKEVNDDSDEKEEKVTISNSELIRLNHILLREIIELRNERDVLRSNIHEYLLSEDDCSTDDQDTVTDDEKEGHFCEHCTEPVVSSKKKDDDEGEDYENKDEEPEMIENESDTE